ncbi:MAG: hypothetical protein JOY79_10545 [Acidobacteriaceae bacterium]|nr:hypothetical protein [Acidobacteriaceae bacterium]
MRNHSRVWLLIALVALAVPASVAKEKEWVAPKAYHARTYPARDAHDDEKVTIAVDPYDIADKASLFTVNYKQEGFLPMLFIVSNDGNQTISLADMKVELVTVKRVKIPAATPDDIYRRITRQPVHGDSPSRGPLPIPRKTVHKGVKKEEQNEIENSQFLAKAVEPNASQSGFLYFDVEGISNPLAGAHLYVSGIRDSKGQELLFFDIPLEKYLSYQPGAKAGSEQH